MLAWLKNTLTRFVCCLEATKVYFDENQKHFRDYYYYYLNDENWLLKLIFLTDNDAIKSVEFNITNRVKQYLIHITIAMHLQ